MYQVFISYESKSIDLANEIVKQFESNSITCWYAPRDVEGPYAQAIVNAIKSAKVFIILLNERASNSHHVLNEVETAYKEMDDSGLVILPFKFSENISDAMMYYIKRFHWVDISGKDLQEGIDELLARTKRILGIKDKPTTNVQERKSNKYFVLRDSKELERLADQRELLEKMTKPTYEKVFAKYNKPIIIDIGSNDGYLTYKIFTESNAKTVVGLECDKDTVLYAQNTYQNENIFFYVKDVEEDDFNEYIKNLLIKHNISGFDIINISMVLLHLRNPFRLLKILRKYLNPNGTFIIRDIDDGFNIAYPDPKGLFKYASDIIARSPRWGFRESGRQIYTYLSRLCLKDISLEAQGINTIGMNFSKREALFHTYFGAILDDLTFALESEPDNTQYINDKKWIQEHLEKLEEEFYKTDFFFNLGFVLFTATNE